MIKLVQSHTVGQQWLLQTGQWVELPDQVPMFTRRHPYKAHHSLGHHIIGRHIIECCL